MSDMEAVMPRPHVVVTLLPRDTRGKENVQEDGAHGGSHLKNQRQPSSAPHGAHAPSA